LIAQGLIARHSAAGGQSGPHWPHP